MPPLCVVIAPSGFKESLSSEQAAAAMAEGVRAAFPDAEVICVPLVDGGEGFTRTLVEATDGEIIAVSATGPVGQPVDAHIGLLGGSGPRTAILEMAAAGGLRLVPRDRRDPLTTSTYGVGELILAALETGAERILLGCGDSGTNDGGAGALQALGARLLDADGQELERGGGALARLDKIDLTGLDPRLEGVTIDLACNIHNVLCGERGVARVFGPQKGASPEAVVELESALERFAEILKRDTGRDIRLMPGSGASGGMGAGLHAALGANLHQRYAIVMQYLDIDSALARADLVLTGEGSLDFQTPRGKIPAEVAARAKERGTPVIAIAGTLGEDADCNLENGIDALFCMMRKPCTLEEGMAEGEALLSASAANVMRAVAIGRGLGQPRSGEAA